MLLLGKKLIDAIYYKLSGVLSVFVTLILKNAFFSERENKSKINDRWPFVVVKKLCCPVFSLVDIVLSRQLSTMLSHLFIFISDSRFFKSRSVLPSLC